MSQTEAQKRAKTKYQKEKLKQVRFWVQNNKYDILQQLSMQSGESMASYIKKAISLRAAADGQPDPFRE